MNVSCAKHPYPAQYEFEYLPMISFSFLPTHSTKLFVTVIQRHIYMHVAIARYLATYRV